MEERQREGGRGGGGISASLEKEGEITRDEVKEEAEGVRVDGGGGSLLKRWKEIPIGRSDVSEVGRHDAAGYRESN